MALRDKITVVVNFVTGKARQSIADVRQEVANANGAFGKMKAAGSGAFGLIRANAATAGLALGAFAAGGAKKAIDAASALDESANALNVTFGENAEAVRQVGANAAREFGLSERAFNEAAVAFAGFAEQVAGPGGDVAAVIDDLMGRAADFASVMNLDLSEAIRIFSSTMAGETEPIKRFGITMSAAEVQAFALANGLAATKAEVTDSVKVQARYGLLMEKTSKTAGDFANTSDGLANSSRILNAQLEDLTAMIGEELIPIAESATNILSGLIGPLGDLKEATEIGGEGAGFLSSGLESLSASVDMVTTAYGGLDASLSDYITSGEAAAEITHKFDQMVAAFDVTLNGAARRIDGVGEALGGVTDVLNDAEKATRAEQRALEDLERAWEGLNDALADQEAILDLQDAFADLEAAAAESWEAATSGAEDAERKARDHERAMLDLKSAVIDYAQEVGNIPPEHVTRVLTEIDNESIQTYEDTMRRLTQPRTVQVGVRVVNTENVPGQTRPGHIPGFGAANFGGGREVHAPINVNIQGGLIDTPTVHYLADVVDQRLREVS